MKYKIFAGLPVLGFIILLICNVGCMKKTRALEQLYKKVAVMKLINENYFKYANGDLNAARKSLLQSVDMLESSSCFENDERASLICLEYTRLAVMAHKLKDKDMEEAYFLSAKYFQLRFLELSNVPLQDAIKEVDHMSIDQQTVLIEKMDASLLHGKLANYNQNIPSK